MNINNHNKIIILVSFFTALTAIGAYIKIPLPPVPITLQTFFVIMSGNILGFKFGALSQIIYLILGLMGIPIFAYGGGPGYIFQPSFGYLLGYPAGAFMIGLILKLFLSGYNVDQISKQKFFFSLIISDLAGILVVFAFGLGYLYFNVKFGLYMNARDLGSIGLEWQQAVKAVFILFLPIDLIKVFLAVALTIGLKKFLIFSMGNC